jgi:hypothetical protein
VSTVQGDTELDAETIAWFNTLDAAEQAEFLELLEDAVGETWDLAPKQIFAEQIWGLCDWMLYGGAQGGGKSELAVKHANDLSVKIPGHVTLIVRQTIPELRRSVILRLIVRLKQFNLPAKYRKLDGVSQFQYTNGSLIECGFLATDENLGQYLSAEYGCIIVDEASLLTSSQIITLASRLRVTRRAAKLGARTHLGLFSNPGGQSHAWLREMFVTATDYGNQLVVYDVSRGIETARVTRTYRAPITVDGATDEQLTEVLIPWAQSLSLEIDPANELVVGFVPAKATDNPHLDPGYMKNLNTLPDRLRRQRRDGNWDVFEGAYFYEWTRDIHVVPWFEIPEGWQHARGADFGSTAPWACLFGAWDNDGNCYLYDECYGGGLTPREQAAQAKLRDTRKLANGKTEKVRYVASLADPSVFADKRGTGKSIADLWRDNGFHVARAKNARIAGWQNVRQYLWDDQATRPVDAPPTARDGWPRLFVLEGTCPNLVRTIPLQQHDKGKNEDLVTTLEDHAVDALRYLLSARPIGARLPPSRNGLGIQDRWNKLMRDGAKKKTRALFNDPNALQ